MAIGHKSYLDLSPELRAEAANKLRAQLRASLANPAFSADQRVEIQARIMHLSHWVAGTIEQPHKPQNHTVTVSETLKVEEKV